MRKTENFGLTYENEFGKLKIFTKKVRNYCPSLCV